MAPPSPIVGSDHTKYLCNLLILKKHIGNIVGKKNGAIVNKTYQI